MNSLLTYIITGVWTFVNLIVIALIVLLIVFLVRRHRRIFEENNDVIEKVDR